MIDLILISMAMLLGIWIGENTSTHDVSQAKIILAVQACEKNGGLSSIRIQGGDITTFCIDGAKFNNIPKKD
jgi:hypothetical protein